LLLNGGNYKVLVNTCKETSSAKTNFKKAFGAGAKAYPSKTDAWS
jgi:hypothetical protein